MKIPQSLRRSLTVVATSTAMLVSRGAAAQPSLTALSLYDVNPQTNWFNGLVYWSTVNVNPQLNWQVWYKTPATSVFSANPPSAIPLAVGVNTFDFAGDSATLNPNRSRLGIAMWLDGGVLPAVSGVSSPNNAGAPIDNAGLAGWNPFMPIGTTNLMPGSTWTGGGYTVQLTRFEYAQAGDAVGMFSLGADRWTDYSGQFDLTVSPAATTTTPEPATAGLMGAGLLALGAVVRRRRFAV